MAFQGDSIYWVETEKVVPNPFQPRREFDEHKLRELADSIRMYGVLQPLTVTRHEIQRDDGTFYSEYELIAGERRLRASRLAGIAQVPVIIREGEESEQEKLELAIIENLQREDLNAVDRALAFKQLAEQFNLSHVEVAKKVGRSREYVSNSIRLLALPENILTSLKHGEISEGHARTLLMLNDRPEEQQVVFEETKLKKLSVRDVEKISREIATEKVRKRDSDDFDLELIALQKQFTDALGTRVQIQKTEFGGRLAIDYFTREDLEVLLQKMNTEASELPSTESRNEASQSLSTSTPLVTHQEPEPDTRELESTKTPVESAVVGHSPVVAPTEEKVAEAPVAEAASNQEEEEPEMSRMKSILAGLTANLNRNDEERKTPVPNPTTPVTTQVESEPVPAAGTSDVSHGPTPSSETKPVDEDDDTDLYAINRFTV